MGIFSSSCPADRWQAWYPFASFLFFIMMACFIARLHERGAFIVVCLLPKSKILPSTFLITHSTHRQGHKATALSSPDSPLCTRVRPHSETLYLGKFWIGEAESRGHSWHVLQIVQDLRWLAHDLTMYDAWTKMLGYQIVYSWSPFTVVSESLKRKKRLKTFVKFKTIISLNFSVLCITLVSPCWQLVFWAKAIAIIFSWFSPSNHA